MGGVDKSYEPICVFAHPYPDALPRKLRYVTQDSRGPSYPVVSTADGATGGTISSTIDPHNYP